MNKEVSRKIKSSIIINAVVSILVAIGSLYVIIAFANNAFSPGCWNSIWRGLFALGVFVSLVLTIGKAIEMLRMHKNNLAYMNNKGEEVGG